MRKFSIATTSRDQFVAVTGQVAQAIGTLGVENGTVTVFVPHTTAGINRTVGWPG